VLTAVTLNVMVLAFWSRSWPPPCRRCPDLERGGTVGRAVGIQCCRTSVASWATVNSWPAVIAAPLNNKMVTVGSVVITTDCRALAGVSSNR
jgi:hypothetical protein